MIGIKKYRFFKVISLHYDNSQIDYINNRLFEQQFFLLSKSTVDKSIETGANTCFNSRAYIVASGSVPISFAIELSSFKTATFGIWISALSASINAYVMIMTLSPG